MKNNQLVWFIAYEKLGKKGVYDYEDPIKFLCPKDDIQRNKIRYSSPEYLSEIKFLRWKELGNCNLIQKVIYKINFPNWLIKFVSAIILLLIGAWINSLFR